MKILVHLHLFYQEMLPEMLDILGSLDGCDYDLVATVINAAPETLKGLRRFKPDVTIIEVENRGYDVAPFIKVLQLTDLTRYDYVIKIHTKQTLKTRAWLDNASFIGDQWRRLLLGFMETPERFRQTLKLFENPDVGMVSHYNLIIEAAKEDKAANARADRIMKEMGLEPLQRRFVGGTMFMARAALFTPLKNYPCKTEDFELYNRDTPGGTLAHAYERLLGWVITAQGRKIISSEPETAAVKLGHSLRKLGLIFGRSLFQYKINRKNKLIIKICKIPVCSWRLKP